MDLIRPEDLEAPVPTPALVSRHLQALEDQIRHGWLTRCPYAAPGAERRGVPRAALEQLARQDRIRLRALCAGLRGARYVRTLRTHPVLDYMFRANATGRARWRDPALGRALSRR